MDITAGKHYAAVVTTNGKLYASGYIFYRYFEDCRSNTENNEDYPFLLRMPNGLKCIKAFGVEKYNGIFVNCVDE